MASPAIYKGNGGRYLGTVKIEKSFGASPLGCIFAGRIPSQVTGEPRETIQQYAGSIPILYVPLPMFVVFAAVEKRRRMSNIIEIC
jgi:hypothetical protein